MHINAHHALKSMILYMVRHEAAGLEQLGTSGFSFNLNPSQRTRTFFELSH